MAKKEITLSEQQLENMRVLWQRGEATVQEVRAALANQKPLAVTTVTTMLSRLEKRGIINHRRENRQYVYFPLDSESDVRCSMVRELVSNVFKGDLKALLSHLVKESEIEPEDLDEIKAMIEAEENKEKKP